MTLASELEQYVTKTHNDRWEKRAGQKVPEAEDLPLKNEAVLLDGTVLYADLADSSGLVKGYEDWFAATVYKNFLYCAARVIRNRGGAVTAYDGDRVMAVFIGEAKDSNAAQCALQINYAATQIVQPAIKARYPNISLVLEHRVGVDTSKLFVARTGIRGSNDLVWVGNAANTAAKLSASSTKYSTYITAEVHDMLSESTRYGGNPRRNMWTALETSTPGRRIYASNWRWAI